MFKPDPFYLHYYPLQGYGYGSSTVFCFSTSFNSLFFDVNTYFEPQYLFHHELVKQLTEKKCFEFSPVINLHF